MKNHTIFHSYVSLPVVKHGKTAFQTTSVSTSQNVLHSRPAHELPEHFVAADPIQYAAGVAASAQSRHGQPVMVKS